MGEFQKRLGAAEALTKENLRVLLFESDDRSIIITASSLLEDMLAFAIIHKFPRSISDSQFAELFTGLGPLASFSAKISMAFLLGAIPENLKHDLHVIKAMRNDCAHIYGHLTFKTPEIARRCDSLKLGREPDKEFDELLNEPHEELEKLRKDPHRLRFTRAVARMFPIFTEQAVIAFEQNLLVRANAATIARNAKARIKTGVTIR
jgi:DNA-binding MltR family transcriptional regulator